MPFMYDPHQKHSTLPLFNGPQDQHPRPMIVPAYPPATPMEADKGIMQPEPGEVPVTGYTSKNQPVYNNIPNYTRPDPGIMQPMPNAHSFDDPQTQQIINSLMAKRT